MLTLNLPCERDGNSNVNITTFSLYKNRLSFFYLSKENVYKLDLAFYANLHGIGSD